MRNQRQVASDIYRPLIPVITFLLSAAIATTMLDTLRLLACLVMAAAGVFAAWATASLAKEAAGRMRAGYRAASAAYGLMGIVPLALYIAQYLVD